MIDNCHFIGIGGIGMSGLARILLSRNSIVTGSDIHSSATTDELAKNGAKVFIGHSSEHILPKSTVVYSSDIKKDNPELLSAVQLQCPLLHRSDLLNHLMMGYKTLAVAGTHGKTTTSALLTAVLETGGLDPTFAVGGIIPQFQTNAKHGAGEYFVAEVDESDGTFLKYSPFGAIITNIDLDHMNFYGTEKALIQAFHEFATKVSSPYHLFWCGDDPRLRNLQLPGISYGLNENVDCKGSNIRQEGWGLKFDITFRNIKYENVEVALIGYHNVLNALAVFGMGIVLGINESSIRNALATFKGVKRRCEKKGEHQGVLFLDDYAHHPTEILTTLKGIRKAIGERRLIAVFQPHRYSRTKDCLGTFSGIFEAADELVITDIYASGEPPIADLTSADVLKEIKEATLLPCYYQPRQQLVNYLHEHLRPHDVVVSLGAGDITKLAVETLEYLQNHPIKKFVVGLVCGGHSVEHEVALVSAQNVLNGFQSSFYDVKLFGITKQGCWMSGPHVIQRLTDGLTDTEYADAIFPGEVLHKLLACDILVPILHGTYGEDGTIQGLFEMLNKPYVGCDYRSSAICMDKTLTKKLVHSAGIPTTPFVSFSREDWTADSDHILNRIHETLTFPIFVKPVHLGSAVGVIKVDDKNNLVPAIQDSFQYDTDLIIETGIIEPREIEFAVIGNHEITVFPPGEICTDGKMYDYDAKYSKNGMATHVNAHISEELKQEGMALAAAAYEAVGCLGMARVDFFLDKNNHYWLNEINPIPGFTQNSLYPKICESHGLKLPSLIDRLLILALQRKRLKNRVKMGK